MTIIPAYGGIGGGVQFEPYGAGSTFVDFILNMSETAGGVLQHRIHQPGSSGTFNAALLAAPVNGALPSATNTPTGADASTAFAAGVKVSTTYGTHVLALDTPDMQIGEGALQATIENSNGGDKHYVYTDLLSSNINGVTRVRPMLVLANRTTGGALAWSTFVPTSGFIRVHLRGWLKAA